VVRAGPQAGQRDVLLARACVLVFVSVTGVLCSKRRRGSFEYKPKHFCLGLVLSRDLKLDGGKQSTGAVSLKEIIGLEGVELGADGKVRLPSFQSASLCRHHQGQDSEAA